MANDRPEDRAARVEKIAETGDLDGAMKALQSEVTGLSQQERLAVFRSLANQKANEKDWRLPNITIDEKTSGWFGYGDKTGDVEVKMNHNAAEQGAMGLKKAIDSVNPFNAITNALDSATSPEKKKK